MKKLLILTVDTNFNGRHIYPPSDHTIIVNGKSTITINYEEWNGDILMICQFSNS